VCGRQQAVVRAVANRLEIPLAATDWRHTLETVEPDIVALATPASLREEVVRLAAARGCHVFCEKPLAATATEAERIYRLAQHAGIKHAYASTHRYDPSVAWLRELVQGGAIGVVREVEYTLRYRAEDLAPWTWWDSLAAGGGYLNNWFTHVLGMLATISGGDVQRVTGLARTGRLQAPVVPNIHDFRVLFNGEKNPTPDEAAHLEWRACDADSAFSAILTTSMAGREVPVTVVVSPVAAAPWPPNGWRLFGDEGTLRADGFTTFDVCRLRSKSADREPLPVPQRLIEVLPNVGDDGINKWAALACDFVADVRGEPHCPYLTFRDGWRYQEAVGAIRAGCGWHELPA